MAQPTTMFNKVVTSIDEVTNALKKSCVQVQQFMARFNEEDDHLDTYEDYVKWALDLCYTNPPSPFSLKRNPTITLGPSYFTVSIPNEFRIGLKCSLKGPEATYIVDIIFNVDETVMKNTSEYIDLIDNGWAIKELNHK